MKTLKKEKEGKSSKNKIYNKKLWDLINACDKNIEELLKCSKILFLNQYYSKSFLMSYLVLEELGKRLLVCDYITDIISEDEFKKGFRDHHLKMAYLHNGCELTKNEINETNNSIFNTYKATIKYDTKKYEKFFIEKQKATYVDFDFESGNILMPSQEISKTEAQELLDYATSRVDETYYYEMVTERIGTKAFLK